MYTEYWHLSEMPFENTADPRFIYFSSQHEEAMSRLLYAVKGHKGAAMLTGIFGCGKSLLGKSLVKELSQQHCKTVLITNPQLDYRELLRTIARHLGSAKLPEKKSDLLADALLFDIEEMLINNMRDGHDTVIIIDEAQVINDLEVFEGLRMLLNFQTDDRFLITLILMGQPELKTKIDNIKQLKQRIPIKYEIGPLSKEDTWAYIGHRLEVAGSKKNLFDEKTLDLIYEGSGGIPRRINNVCDLALMEGFSKQAKIIDAEIIREVIKEV